MKKILFFSALLLITVSSFSQGVAINTSNAIPDSSANMDVGNGQWAADNKLENDIEAAGLNK